MNWEALTSIVAICGLGAGGLALFVRLSIRSALGDFKADLLQTLNGRYPSRREADVILAEFSRRLELLENR